MIIINKIKTFKDTLRVYNKSKIFGIGANKTGTTSLEAAMKNLGFITGNQRKAENLINQWAERNFDEIIKYCHSAQFFQDVPFSLPFTYIVLDNHFPNSKFILTVRDNSDQWYNSITKFHAKLWGENGRIPTEKDLKNANYIYKGRPWHTNRLLFNTPKEEPYKKDLLINYYEQHNNSVKEYFRYRQEDLLILNVGEVDAHKKLCDFLKLHTTMNSFPWENKTD